MQCLNSVFRTMDSCVEYKTIVEPVMPLVAAPITEQQRNYNPLQDPEAQQLTLEAMLCKAGLDNYANVIIHNHGITNITEYSELQECDLKLFCKVARDRVLLRKLLANLKTLQNASVDETEISETGNEDTMEFSNSSSKTFENFSEYLRDRSEGKAIMRYYDEHGTLTNALRNEMVKIILMDATAQGIETNSNFNDFISQKIVATFPNESAEIYYKSGHTIEGTRKGATGKLLKRKSQVLEALGIRKPKIKRTDNQIPAVITDEEQLNARTWLLDGRSPIETVRENWEACFELRRSDVENAKDTVEVFQLYPILKTPKSTFLIDLDFERMHPGATSNFYARFPLLHQKLETHIRCAVSKDKTYLPLLEAYETSMDGDKKDYLLCMLLPLILQTNYRVKGNWKPSVRETQNSFILEVETADDIAERIDERINFLKGKFDNVCLQPQIVAVGATRSDTGLFVIFEGTEYIADNILHAVCICVQISCVLNLQYAPDCKPLWLFVQSYLFKISASNTELPKSTRHLLGVIDEE
ncbi:uncharacterized protein LOC129719439 isoform X2 [Wyeomyia smithii]|uniref:uncharacterized protein LOC129719439 isoform X2 n=1 Tax=Wyeomyia smithii TaxID=174621 RepID=UPI002467BB4C|nr:uncharacterized protein LOC129719439 isoform X2 [Wyeomyia smithii]